MMEDKDNPEGSSGRPNMVRHPVDLGMITGEMVTTGENYLEGLKDSSEAKTPKEKEPEETKKGKLSFLSELNTASKVTIIVMIIIGAATLYIQWDAKSDTKAGFDSIGYKLDELVQPEPFFIMELNTYYATGEEIREFIKNKKIESTGDLSNISGTRTYYFDIITLKNAGEGVGDIVSGEIYYYSEINYIASLPTEFVFEHIRDGNTYFEIGKIGEISQTKTINFYNVYEANQEVDYATLRGTIYTKQGVYYISDSRSKRFPLINLKSD